MEIYVNKAGNLVSVEGMKEGVNLTVKISKGGQIRDQENVYEGIKQHTV